MSVFYITQALSMCIIKSLDTTNSKGKFRECMLGSLFITCPCMKLQDWLATNCEKNDNLL